jgi:hypothetical protein
MALVGNLLNAVGGQPQIGRPGLVPTYPGRLPAPVLPDLIVRLRKCSIEQVKNVFMAIEQPEQPVVDGRRFTGAVIDPHKVNVDRAGTLHSIEPATERTLEDWYNKATYTPLTIGWFYNTIARAISRLDRNLARTGRTLFTGDPARQVSWPEAPGTLYKVTDRKSALLAIYEIIEQGEGSPHDLNRDGVLDPNEFGHYYRFKEIVEGRKLIKKNGKWVYEGDPVPFDPSGVYPMVDDPDTFSLPADSVARRESALCDESFTKLLTSLNRVFNGNPGELGDAIGLMYAVQVQAKKLLNLPTAPGASTVVGPAFQSPGVVL